MKKLLAIASIIALSAFLYAHVACAADKKAHLSNCISSISTLQTYIEFYYMETGVYPSSLNELKRIFNEDVKNESDKVNFPKDPATGKEFIYSAKEDLLSYTLSCPEPSAYGLDKLTITSINWGWMNVVAQEKRKRAYAYLCKEIIEFIGAMVQKYHETEKKRPENLNVMVPKYLKSVPGCSSSKKEVIYKVEKDKFTISCPNPGEHGFRTFFYDSREGFKADPLETQQKEVKKDPKENLKEEKPLKKPKK